MEGCTEETTLYCVMKKAVESKNNSNIKWFGEMFTLRKCDDWTLREQRIVITETIFTYRECYKL